MLSVAEQIQNTPQSVIDDNRQQGRDLSAEGRGAKGCLPPEVCLARGPVGSGGLAWREPMREPNPSAELPLPPPFWGCTTGHLRFTSQEHQASIAVT